MRRMRRASSNLGRRGWAPPSWSMSCRPLVPLATLATPPASWSSGGQPAPFPVRRAPTAPPALLRPSRAPLVLLAPQATPLSLMPALNALVGCTAKKQLSPQRRAPLRHFKTLWGNRRASAAPRTACVLHMGSLKKLRPRVGVASTLRKARPSFAPPQAVARSAQLATRAMGSTRLLALLAATPHK